MALQQLLLLHHPREVGQACASFCNLDLACGVCSTSMVSTCFLHVVVSYSNVGLQLNVGN